MADDVRSVDSETLLKELERRGNSHTIGNLRPEADDAPERRAELDTALKNLDVDPAALMGPPLKAYNTYIRPRTKSTQQTASNAAQQIAFLHRHELSRREALMRNTDSEAQKRRELGLKPHPLIVVLDNVRSAENVGSIFRTADCARCASVVTCGFTPNPTSTAKLAKTAFGAETALVTRHFDTTRAALEDLKAAGVTIWALETYDSAVSHTAAPLPPDKEGQQLALVLGNEVTGVDLSLLPLVDAIVEIPTFGTKNSMNVAVAAGIVLYDVLRRWDLLRQ